MAVSDEYLREVIQKGDKGSSLLAKICSSTLKNNEFIDEMKAGMNGIAVIRPFDDNIIVVHSSGGDHNEKDLVKYSESLVDRLVFDSKRIGARPIAFANVIDASEIDMGEIQIIGETLASKASEEKIAIVNGELAALGNRVNGSANISGTMISHLHRSKVKSNISEIFTSGRTVYAIFDAKGKPIYVNSDGVGTKIEFAERTGNFEFPLWDSVAMKADDAVKLGAKIRVMSDVVETDYFNPMNKLTFTAEHISRKFGFAYILQHEKLGSRINGYGRAMNISGSAVSTIDEDVLKNLPRPKPGDTLIAIRGKPNPRSNGITDKRKIMIEMLGNDWHDTPVGQSFMEFLGEPSTVFYGIFTELREKGLASSFYHMSGGAFDGKLAKPLAKHDLYVKINNLFPADWREKAIAGQRFTLPEVAYAKWPMGNEAFVSSSKPADAIKYIEKNGCEARDVGILEKSMNGLTGVMLEGIRASNGEFIRYSGK